MSTALRSFSSAAMAGTGTASSLTIPAPSGIQDGDVMLAQLIMSFPSTTITPPSGWTLIAGDTTQTGGYATAIYGKVASGESGDYTFTLGAARYALAGNIAVWDGSQLVGSPPAVSSWAYDKRSSFGTYTPDGNTFNTAADPGTNALTMFALFGVTANDGATANITVSPAGFSEICYIDKYKGSIGAGASAAHTHGWIGESYQTGAYPTQGFDTDASSQHVYYRIRIEMDADFAAVDDSGGDTGCDESWTVLHGSTGGGGGGADLSDSTPATVGIDSGATAGASDEASRADHKHQIATTDAPSGAAISVDANPSAAATGAVARAAHGHRLNTYSSTPAAVTSAGGAGTSATAPARGDHAHPHEAAHIAHDTAWAAKGDIIAATGNDAAAVVTVGADGKVLTADSGASAGVSWQAASSGRAFTYSRVG